ncbi:hypothetical protein AOLI_G00310950 [Acnodon oligacanthus]
MAMFEYDATLCSAVLVSGQLLRAHSIVTGQLQWSSVTLLAQITGSVIYVDCLTERSLSGKPVQDCRAEQVFVAVWTLCRTKVASLRVHPGKG